MPLAGERPGLDPGVAFPLAALGEEVVFQHVERADQRSRFAVGPQAHVHPERLTVGRDVGNGGDQLAAETGEELEIGYRLAAVGVAVVRVGEDEIDVGRNIQFAAAQFAHADDNQFLHFALGVAGQAVAAGKGAGQDVHRDCHRRVGQERHRFGDFGQRRLSVKVTPAYVGKAPLLEPAQRPFQGFLDQRLGA